MSEMSLKPTDYAVKLHNIKRGKERLNSDMIEKQNNDPEYKRFLKLAIEDYPAIQERQKPSISITRLLANEPKYIDALKDVALLNALKASKNSLSPEQQQQAIQANYKQFAEHAANIIINNPEDRFMG